MNNKNQNHCVCVANLSPEELDALLQEISIRLGVAHQAAKQEHCDVDPTKQNLPNSKMEGDGEEVFGQMLDDLLYAATMLDALYGILIASYVLFGRLSAVDCLGIPYLAPVAPWRPHNPDLVARLPIWLQNRLNFYAEGNSWLKKEQK